MAQQKTGVLITNLGTPDSPSTTDVRRYLAQFLMDGRVLDMNPVGRTALVYGAILPTRPAKSAEAYQQIWTERGSPLLFHTQDLAAGVAEALGDDFVVEVGMRYGNPSLPDALKTLVQQDPDRIIVLPLYPQYASSSTGTALQEIYHWAAKQPYTPSISVVPPYYDHHAFIEAQAEVAAESVFGAEHVLMSFHGLPLHHMTALHPEHCRGDDTCSQTLTGANRHCYRAQSYETARRLAAALNLDEDRYSVSFQSRLGRAEWIRPYTDHRLVELGEQGVKDLAVICPSFVSDCLETLEEMGIRGRADFLAAGGERYRLAPCVNGHPSWVAGATALVQAV